MKNGPRGPVFSYYLAERVAAAAEFPRPFRRSPKFAKAVADQRVRGQYRLSLVLSSSKSSNTRLWVHLWVTEALNESLPRAFLASLRHPAITATAGGCTFK